MRRALILAALLLAGRVVAQPANGWQPLGNGWSELKSSPATGTVTTTGTLASGQVALGSGATSITGDAGLTYDAGTDTLTVAGPLYTSATGAQTHSNGSLVLMQGQVTKASSVFGLYVDTTHNSDTGDVYGILANAAKGAGKLGKVLAVEGYASFPHQGDGSVHYGITGDVRADANGKTGTINVGAWALSALADTNIGLLVSTVPNEALPASGDYAIYSADSGYTTYLAGPVQVGAGTSLAPAIAPAAWPDEGLYFGNGAVRVSIGGAPIMVLSGAGGSAGAYLNLLTPRGIILDSATGEVVVRPSTANNTLEIGALPSATPVANTLVIGESGVGTNIAGGNGTISSGAGTGSATGSSIVFQTPTAGASGTTGQTQTTRLTLSEPAVIAAVPVRLKGYTVATLPAGTVGDTAYCTDLTTPTFMGTAVGGGAVVGKVFYNGSAWITQ